MRIGRRRRIIRRRPTTDVGATIVSAMHAWSTMKTARSNQRTFSPSLIFALAVIPALAPHLARAADASLAPPSATYAIPAPAAVSAIYAVSVTAANSPPPAAPLMLPHPDERSAPNLARAAD